MHTKLKQNLIDRFETKNYSSVNFDNKNKKEIIFTHLIRRLPQKGTIWTRRVLNVYLLDLFFTYRGWRHFRNLPVHGQRTWSNAKTARNINIFLRSLKIEKATKVYGNLPKSEVYTALMAENVNLMWKQQWRKDWKQSRDALISSKSPKKVMRIDLYSLAKGNVMTPRKFSKLSKKKKQAFNKNHFTLGFDIGFTKILLRELFEIRGQTNTRKKSPLILHKIDPFSRRRKKKKKVDIKAKRAAHIAKKKAKKTAWD